MFALFAFEAITGAGPAAAFHARALQTILESRRRQGQRIDPCLVSAAEYQDLNRALMYGQRPIINTDKLLEPTFLEEVDRFAERVKVFELQMPDRQNGLAGTGLPHRVQHLLARMIHLLDLARVSQKAIGLITEETDNSWTHNMAICTSKLLLVFDDARADIETGAGNAQLLHREAACSLAVVYWGLVAMNCDCQSHGVSTWWKTGFPQLPTSQSVLPVLGKEIEAIDWNQIHEAPPSLRLWLLSIAVLAEQSMRSVSRNHPGPRCVHNVEFAAQARTMGLWSWDSVILNLARYLYHPGTSRMARMWFEMAMQNHAREAENGTLVGEVPAMMKEVVV